MEDFLASMVGAFITARGGLHPTVSMDALPGLRTRASMGAWACRTGVCAAGAFSPWMPWRPARKGIH